MRGLSSVVSALTFIVRDATALSADSSGTSSGDDDDVLERNRAALRARARRAAARADERRTEDRPAYGAEAGERGAEERVDGDAM